MIVRNKRVIKQFIAGVPEAKAPLKHWVETVEAVTWSNPADVAATFNKADMVNGKWIFTIAGNNWDWLQWSGLKTRLFSF